jgi:hypothetical protein
VLPHIGASGLRTRSPDGGRGEEAADVEDVLLKRSMRRTPVNPAAML